MARTNQSELSDRLGSIPVFRGLTPLAINRLANAATEREAGRRTRLFVEGQEVNEFFVLIGGCVKLSLLTADGCQFALGLVSPNEPFGTVAVTPRHRHSTTAEVVQHARTLVWTAAAMRQAFADDARLVLNALDLVSARLDALHVHFSQFATEPVQRRVARVVLRLPQPGRPGDAIAGSDCPISRQEIAEMCGTTLFTVSRLLCSWQRRGIVRLGRQRVVVVRPAALAAIANGAALRTDACATG
ncbi:MAG: Crp/Fnr family transcriptional regulator [Acidobacteriota bacterium]